MTNDDAYAVASAGSLKLKGGHKKKKSKSSSTKSSREGSLKARPDESTALDVKGKGHAISKHERSHDGDSRASDDEQALKPPAAVTSGPQRTKAELRFEEAQRKRMQEKIAKEAKTSHKDKVDRFNEHLASLTEHFDLPKVGPG